MFTLPIFNVIWIASTTDVNISPRLYEHVVSGDDIGDGRQFWIIPGDPESYGNVIRGISEGYRQYAMDAEQQLSSAIVISWLDIQVRWNATGKNAETEL